MTDRGPLDPATDEALSALVDGELDASSARALRQRAESEPAIALRLAELEAIDAQLRALPAPEVPVDLPARLRARISAQSDSPLRPITRVGPVRPQRRAHRLPWVVGAALAAGLALYLAIDLPQDPERLAEASDVADDELAIAFEYEALRDFELIDQLELLEVLAAAADTEASG